MSSAELTSRARRGARRRRSHPRLLSTQCQDRGQGRQDAGDRSGRAFRGSHPRAAHAPFPVVRVLRRGNRQVAHGRRERLAGRSHRRHQVLRARVPVLLHADRAHARRAIRVRRVLRAGLQRAGLGRARWRRVSRRQADSRQPGRFARRAPSFRPGISRRWRHRSLGPLRRADRRRQPASAAMAISCTTTCWRAARSTWSSNPT